MTDDERTLVEQAQRQRLSQVERGALDALAYRSKRDPVARLAVEKALATQRSFDGKEAA